MTDSGIDRRDFLKGAAATVALLMAAEGLGVSDAAAAEANDKPMAGPPVKIGVIGLGQWGKEIVTELATMPSANVTAICDTYEPYRQTRGQDRHERQDLLRLQAAAGLAGRRGGCDRDAFAPAQGHRTGGDRGRQARLLRSAAGIDHRRGQGNRAGWSGIEADLPGRTSGPHEPSLRARFLSS